LEVRLMKDAIDTSKGWCCDGRTWTEHAGEGGRCCQALGTKLEDLPVDGQRKARERLTADQHR
jgi:hypothetical protein